MGFIETLQSLPSLHPQAQLRIAGAVLSLLLLPLLVVKYFQWRRLRHVPGPFLNSLTSWVQGYYALKGTYPEYMEKLMNEYGMSKNAAVG